MSVLDSIFSRKAAAKPATSHVDELLATATAIQTENDDEIRGAYAYLVEQTARDEEPDDATGLARYMKALNKSPEDFKADVAIVKDFIANADIFYSAGGHVHQAKLEAEHKAAQDRYKQAQDDVPATRRLAVEAGTRVSTHNQYRVRLDQLRRSRPDLLTDLAAEFEQCVQK